MHSTVNWTRYGKLVSDTRLADTGAAVSVGGWFVTFAVQAEPIIQALAGIVAIIAGVFAARYHYLKAEEIKKNGNHKGGPF